MILIAMTDRVSCLTWRVVAEFSFFPSLASWGTHPLSEQFPLTPLMKPATGALRCENEMRAEEEGRGLASTWSLTRDFPGGPVVMTLSFHCRGCRLDPRSGT